MYKIFLTTSIFFASVIVVNIPHAADAATVTLSADQAETSGALLEEDSAEMHILPNTFDGETTCVIRNRGNVHRSQLPKQYRSRMDSYEYSCSKETQSDLVIRLEYRALGKDRARKHVLYTEQENGEWFKMRTVVDKESQYLEIRTQKSSGVLLAAKHRYKKERPIQAENFTPYAGANYSDTAAILDVASGKFLYRQKAKKKRPIASITKIMSVMTFLDAEPNLKETVTYSTAFNREGASVILDQGDKLTLRDVLMGALLPSANNMTQMLSASAGMSESAFVDKMNANARDLGLKRTVFYEPTGLNQNNVSTAGNIARLARHAFRKHGDIFHEAAHTGRYDFTVQNSGKNKTLYTTNKFDGQGRYEVVAFKTGYYPGAAERTLVMQLKDVHTGAEIVVVSLGNETYGTIFDQTREMADWAFSNWVFHNYGQAAETQ